MKLIIVKSKFAGCSKEETCYFENILPKKNVCQQNRNLTKYSMEQN